MKKNVFYTIFIVIFLLLCCLPGVGMLVAESPKPRANEILSPKPLWKDGEGRWNASYFEELTNYVGDHFAGRSQLITWHSQLLANVFHVSGADEVLLGKEGWLFYQETKDDYLGQNLLSQKEIETIAHTIKMMEQYVETTLDADFLFFVAPNKNSLYPQFMPNVGEPLTKENNLTRLQKALDAEGVDSFDMLSFLQEQDEILYHRLDSHWNNKGAALARDALLQYLGRFDGEAFGAGSYTIVQNHKGDLYEMLYPTGETLDDNVVFDREWTYVPDNTIHGPDDIQIDTSCFGKGGSLLMFRDSFGNALYPFLAESFGHSRFSRKIPYPLDMAEEVAASVVMVEIVERNIDYLGQYAPLFPAPEVSWEDFAEITADDFSVTVEVTEESSLEGYSCIQGSYEDIGEDSFCPVYVEWQGVLYEACPVGAEGENSFTAYVPHGTAEDMTKIFVEKNGILLEKRV